MPSPEIDALIAEVAADDTVFDSAVTFITGVPALIQAAVDKAIANGATPAQLAAVQGVVTDLRAKSQAIQDAITANTPPA
jgi:hypothetical protein